MHHVLMDSARVLLGFLEDLVKLVCCTYTHHSFYVSYLIALWYILDILYIYIYMVSCCCIELEVCGNYSSYFCGNNATCVSDQCDCPYPYTGYTCESTICK